MSDRSHNHVNGSVRPSRCLCQSAWMAHWSDTSCKIADRASLNYELKEDDHTIKHQSLLGGSESKTSVSIFGKEFREVTDVRTAKIMDDRPAVKTSQISIHGKEVLALQIDPNSGYESPPTWKCTKPYPSRLEWVSPKPETPAKNNNLQHLGKPVKFHNFFEKNSLPASRSSKDDFMGSTSKTLPYGVSCSAPILSMCIGEEMGPSSSLLASKEPMVNSYSACVGRTINSTGPGFSILGHDDAVLSLHDPSASNNKLPVVFGKQCKKPLDHMGTGVKLQLLGSSTDSEEKENGGNVNTSLLRLKNESSEDTDTLDMNALHENHLSAREDTGQILLDINQRLPELPAVANSTDDKDTSSSRTQSLDLERLFSNAEEAANSKSNAWPDPSSRWIKRLKLSSSDCLGHGTKSSKLPEAFSQEKADTFFSKMKRDTPTSSEALNLNSRRHGKEEIKAGKPLGHSWIRRWCHNQPISTHNSPEAVVICKPETFKETSDKFKKKQFPSIAAMALMGKVMKHNQPCELQNLGPSVVWNTKQF